MTEEVFDALVTVLDMYLADEQKHYEADPSDEHVYVYLSKLQAFLDNSKKVTLHLQAPL